MAGTVLELELARPKSTGISFSLAGEEDDSEIRRLLRENPMPGRISLSLEREPKFFADAVFESEKKQTIIARENERVVCVGSCAIRRRFVNGKPRMVGYLGGLRLDGRVAGRFDILRRGYDFFHQLQQEKPADFYFTSIAEDNERARGFLERGLVGMPRYEFIGELVTLVIATSLHMRDVQTSQKIVKPESADEVVGFINEENRDYQFAPCWAADEVVAIRRLMGSRKLAQPFQGCGCEVPQTQGSLASSATLGFEAESLWDSQIEKVDGNSPSKRRRVALKIAELHDPGLLVLRGAQNIEACGVLWDQRNFRQVVVRGYTKWLKAARPFVNAFSRFAGTPRLPTIGESLSIAFASHLASKNDASLIRLIQHLSNAARQRDIELLTFGFASNDPRLSFVRKHFRCREYQSRIYLVHWPGIGGTARDLDNRILAPEIALL